MRMREFNFALLGKWCWRMYGDQGNMWYKVFVARYGEVGATKGWWEGRVSEVKGYGGNL